MGQVLGLQIPFQKSKNQSMKTILILICAGLFATNAWADGEVKQGVLRSLVEGNTDHFYLSDEKANFKPNVRSRLILDLNFDDNYQSTNRQNELRETRANGRFFSTFNLSRNLFISSFLRLEESLQASTTSRRNAASDGGGSRSFENHGAYFEELSLTYDSKNRALIAGKFNSNYGRAWRQGRGIWTGEIANNYRQQEKLGFGTILRAGNSKTTGKYNFGFSAFTNDRKNLDNSVITKRDSNHKSDAKPGDTRSLESYVASLDIDFDFSPQEKLTYHFAYTNLAINKRQSIVEKAKIDDQKGFVASLNYKYPLAKNFDLDGLIEYSNTKNFGGDSDISESYLTANLIAKIYKNWNVTLGNSSRKNIEIDRNGFDQNSSEISAGYDFDKTIFFDRLALQVGHKNQRTNYKNSIETQNVLGVLLRYYKNF